MQIVNESYFRNDNADNDDDDEEDDDEEEGAQKCFLFCRSK